MHLNNPWLKTIIIEIENNLMLIKKDICLKIVGYC